MATVQLIDAETVRVAIPELAAADFDGGTIGQSASGLMKLPDGESVETYEAWRTAARKRVGKGSQRIVDCGLDTLAELEIAFDALAIGNADAEMAAEARACRIAVERVLEARRMLAAARGD